MNRYKKHISNIFLRANIVKDQQNKLLSRSIEELFETILNFLPEGIWIYDGDGKVLMVNKAAEQLEGLKFKDIVGKTYDEVFKIGLFDRMIAPEIFKSKKEVSILSYSHRSKKQLLITGTPIFDKNGDIALVINILRDMTELTRLQKQLKESQEVTRGIKEELNALNLMELKNQQIIAQSDAMKRVLNIAIKLTAIDAGVILVLGESGTGKGLISKFIHKSGQRKKNPFIQINCAALPENLLEAELFGYQAGAFTGASRSGKVGRIELADKGTLFLDEIGELPLSLQAKLLKFLEDQEVIRLGGVQHKKVDCTIIAATNCDLKSLVKQKRFRQDLYYRLEAFTINIPPLRERPEDIFELVTYFSNKYQKRYDKHVRISSKGMIKLCNSPWPGNVRQLKNAVNMAVAMGEENNIDQLILEKIQPFPADNDFPASGGNDCKSYNERIAETEKKILMDARKKYKSIRGMAAYLKLGKSSIARKLKKHGLS